MQRPIKFRAWYKLSNEMLSEPFDGEHFGETTSLNLVITGCEEDEHQILMQFTGLKDKNGVEIYEGDIVKAKNHEYETVGKVWFDDEYWHGWAIGETRISAFIRQYFEVVGNIYENPELLDAKAN